MTNTFDYAYLAKAYSTAICFATLAAACGNAAASDTIYASDKVFSENLLLNKIPSISNIN